MHRISPVVNCAAPWPWLHIQPPPPPAPAPQSQNSQSTVIVVTRHTDFHTSTSILSPFVARAHVCQWTTTTFRKRKSSVTARIWLRHRRCRNSRKRKNRDIELEPSKKLTSSWWVTVQSDSVWWMNSDERRLFAPWMRMHGTISEDNKVYLFFCRLCNRRGCQVDAAFDEEFVFVLLPFCVIVEGVSSILQRTTCVCSSTVLWLSLRVSGRLCLQQRIHVCSSAVLCNRRGCQVDSSTNNMCLFFAVLW